MFLRESLISHWKSIVNTAYDDSGMAIILGLRRTDVGEIGGKTIRIMRIYTPITRKQPRTALNITTEVNVIILRLFKVDFLLFHFESTKSVFVLL